MLTSVEPDAHRHGLATQAFTEAGVSGSVRAIEGDPTTVLPRLADGGYDLVLLQTADDPALVDHATRLVREGAQVRPAARAVVSGLVSAGDDDPASLLGAAGLDVVALPLGAGLVAGRRPAG